MQNKPINGKQLVTFRKWSRKPYAVFSSLKMLLKISVLSVAYTLVNPVQECKAQTDSTGIAKKIELDEVEISGQRSPVVYSQMARVVSVITRSEVEQAPAQSINELLENIPQVDIRQRGTNGVQADISLQGGSFDQTLILLNGINLTDPQTGHHNLNLPIDLSAINRIEILKGPASRIFGPNAFAGAVNFITGDNSLNQIKGSFTAGEYGFHSEMVSINNHSRHLTNFLTISKSACDGYIQNTEYNILNTFYHGIAHLKNNKFHLLLGYTERQFGANSFYSPKYPIQKESTNTLFSGLKLETGKSIKLTPTIYWRRNYDHFKLLAGSLYSHNYHYTDVLGAGINTTIPSKYGKTSIGADYRKEIINSTSLGKPLSTDNQKKIPGENNKYYTFNDSRDNISLFAEHIFSIKKLNISTGLMANKNTSLLKTGLFPGIDISYTFNDIIKLYATTNRSLRLPTFTNLFYNSKSQQIMGNTDLKPEKAWIIEAGIKTGYNETKGYLSYFHKWGTETIDYIWRDTVWHAENITELNTDGIEASIQYVPQNTSFIQQISLSYSLVLINKASGEFRSMYILDHLKNKITASISHKIYKNISAYWQCSLQERYGYYDKWNPESNTNTQEPYGSHILLDGKVYWQNKWLKIFGEASNILNSSYIDLGNIEQPGIWFKGGLEITIN